MAQILASDADQRILRAFGQDYSDIVIDTGDGVALVRFTQSSRNTLVQPLFGDNSFEGYYAALRQALTQFGSP